MISLYDSYRSVVVCEHCRGKGTQFNKISLLLSIGLPIAWFMDADILRKKCEHCNGKGILK